MLIDILRVLIHNFIINIDHFLIFLIFHSHVFVSNNVDDVNLYTFLNSLIPILNIMVMLKSFYVIVLVAVILVEQPMLKVIEIFTSF